MRLTFIILCLIFSLFTGCNEQKKVFENIESGKALTMMKNNPQFIIVDVRTPVEFISKHIEKAINIDYRSYNFKEDVSLLDKNKTYILYCRSGNRSGKALKKLEEWRFTKVYNVVGGMIKWVAEGKPTVAN